MDSDFLEVRFRRGGCRKNISSFFLGGGMGRGLMGWCLDDSNPVLPPAGSTSEVCFLYLYQQQIDSQANLYLFLLVKCNATEPKHMQSQLIIIETNLLVVSIKSRKKLTKFKSMHYTW